MRNRPITVIAALLFSLLIPAFGCVYLGPLVAFLFLVGYLGGFVLWVLMPPEAPWSSVRVPYWTTFAAFLFLHKVEENRTRFLAVLGEEITGVPVPEVTPLLIVGLLVLPVGAWLLVPVLMKRGHPLGYYLAWSFFVSMGITELAHFVFPLLTGEPYGYFPGMASVFLLAPVAWWGLWRLSRRPGRDRAGMKSGESHLRPIG